MIVTKGLTVNDLPRDGCIELRNVLAGNNFNSISQSVLSFITRRLPRHRVKWWKNCRGNPVDDMIIKIQDMIYEHYVRVGGLPLETACNSLSESVEHVKDIPNDCWVTSPVPGKGYVRAVRLDFYGAV